MPLCHVWARPAQKLGIYQCLVHSGITTQLEAHALPLYSIEKVGARCVLTPRPLPQSHAEGQVQPFRLSPSLSISLSTALHAVFLNPKAYSKTLNPFAPELIQSFIPLPRN
jgi:hypothetical protein